MPRALAHVRRTSMRVALRPVLGVATLALLGACRHQAPVETGLNKDLALADQLQRASAPALVSTQELSPVPAATPPVTRSAAPARVAAARVAPTRVVVRTVERAPSASVEPATVDRTIGGEVVASGPAAPAEHSRPVTDDGYDAGATATSMDRSAPSVAASSAPVYRQQPQAHTARDGVFGSIAGAIIGAATSHGDRVRGGLIGAAAGGALGAIYGHSVDRTYASVQSAYPTYSPSTGYRRTPRYRGTI